MAVRYTLGAGERLKRGQHIEALFRQGKALSVFPVRLIWRLAPRNEEPYPIQAGFSAPKKKFRNASDRNRVKRLLREAWRLNKHELAPSVPEQFQLQVFIQCVDKSIPEYPALTAAVQQSISRLKKTLGDVTPA